MAAVACLPALVSVFPMGPDLGMHFYSIAALRYFSNRQMFPEGLLELQLGRPNQLFSLATVGLGFLMSLTTAVKLSVMAASATYVLGVSRLCRHLGKTPWAVCFAVPMSLGFGYFYGMQAFQLGTGLMFAALVELDRFVLRPSAKLFLAILAWIGVLYFAHQQVMVFYCGAALLLAASQAEWRARFAARIAPLGIGVAVTFVQLWEQNQQLLETAVVPPAPVFAPLKVRLGAIPSVLFGAQMSTTARAFAGVFLAGLAAIAYYRFRGSRLPSRNLREILHGFRFELLALSSLVLYFTAPNVLNTANYLAERFLPWAVVLGAIALTPSTANLPKLLRALVFLLPFGFELTMVPALREVNSQARQLEMLLPYVKPGSAIAMLDADIEEPDRPFTLVYGDSWLAAQVGGRPLHNFNYTTISVTRFQKKARWRDSLTRLLAPKTLNFRPKLDFTAFRYVLIRSQTVAKNQLVARLLMPQGRFVVSTGYWTLMESTLPVRPLTVFYGMPSYCGDSLGDRLLKVRDLINERDWLESGLEEGGQCTPAGGIVGEAAEQVWWLLRRTEAERDKARGVSEPGASGEGSIE